MRISAEPVTERRCRRGYSYDVQAIGRNARRGGRTADRAGVGRGISGHLRTLQLRRNYRAAGLFVPQQHREVHPDLPERRAHHDGLRVPHQFAHRDQPVCEAGGRWGNRPGRHRGNEPRDQLPVPRGFGRLEPRGPWDHPRRPRAAERPKQPQRALRCLRRERGRPYSHQRHLPLGIGRDQRHAHAHQHRSLGRHQPLHCRHHGRHGGYPDCVQPGGHPLYSDGARARHGRAVQHRDDRACADPPATARRGNDPRTAPRVVFVFFTPSIPDEPAGASGPRGTSPRPSPPCTPTPLRSRPGGSGRRGRPRRRTRPGRSSWCGA